ncbi:hypothetical protein GH810_01245 [Acetobacterium paludosum]|uniref:Cell division protein FtsL n=2 Tax=Acetobacterium TaxID=33951 RepID=A0A923KUY1_9FIRM|nr:MULTISPECIES: hypothetical protein [Acetobacterium]MBC3795846.1 hypothetical protein [Acetobacterium tundrae]MBC3886940.1 hypothetical protein [Acetobacterium paludosum]
MATARKRKQSSNLETQNEVRQEVVTTERQKRRSKQKKKILTPSSYIAMTALVVFAVMAGLLFQHSMITEKNTEILSLQKTLNEAIQANDSKEGQLVTNMNLQSIEAQARSYGMTEPTQAQYRKEVVSEQKKTATTLETEKVKSWFENLF